MLKHGHTICSCTVSPFLYTLSVYTRCSCPSLYIVLYTISVYAHCWFLSVLVHCLFLYIVRSCTLYPFMHTVFSCPFLYIVFPCTLSVLVHYIRLCTLFLSILDIDLTCTLYVFEPYSVSDALYIILFYPLLQSI